VSDAAALGDLELVSRGKVRDAYAVGDDRLLMVASDRISTYDVVHPTEIPDKGRVLCGLSAFWFERTGRVCPNHLVSYTDVPEASRGRAMLVERLEMFPVECVVRGYITGSGWKDYQASGEVCGIRLPAGLQESERLPEPIFTPATKAEVGDHDENVDFERAAEIVGDRALLEELRRLSIELYRFGEDHAREAGILLADTKFEFGRDGEGRIVLGDEAMTPDSSRFWPADGYEPGRPQPSFDKQYVRDWASASGWDKSPPAPALPDEVVEGTRARYREAYERIAGEPFESWLERSGAPVREPSQARTQDRRLAGASRDPRTPHGEGSQAPGCVHGS
jgi:phosphoribosylaminoimidazole-succinocarboxamide synthase